jgi:AcrR family transcriptional regulator
MNPKVKSPRLTRAEKQTETRRLLLEAAEDVFRRRGFAGATVEEITEQAGFSRGAFYSNFESREQLFIELLHKRVYDEFTRMLERTPRKRTARAQMRSTAREFARRYEHGERWLFELWLECLAEAAPPPGRATPSSHRSRRRSGAATASSPPAWWTAPSPRSESGRPSSRSTSRQL